MIGRTFGAISGQCFKCVSISGVVAVHVVHVVYDMFVVDDI